jgi:hypothetical protein
MALINKDSRETKRALVGDYATLVFGIALVGIVIGEYATGNFEGNRNEIGAAAVGFLLIIKPTILVDIINGVSKIFQK